jgi:hypothetical protein
MGNLISDTDVTNWLGGDDATTKASKIERAETLIHRITKDLFYQAALDKYLNGNGSDRLFVTVKPKILSVTYVYVHGILLDTTYYTNDDRSIYLDPDALTNVELKYILKTRYCLFPHGNNNIRVVGLYGWATTPENIKECAIKLVSRMNDESLYTHVINGTETFGSRSYNTNESMTGIIEVDEVLKHYVIHRPKMAA